MRNAKHTLAAGLFFVLAALLLGPFQAVLAAAGQETAPVKIGVLAKRGEEVAAQNWLPTAEALGRELPGRSFTIVPLDFAGVRQAVREGAIDFLICNSAFYVEMEHDFGVSRIATMKNLSGELPAALFGGVIFTRAERTDINGLADLDGRSFLAVDRNSLGGWLMALRELRAQGLRPERDFSSLAFAGTHDAVVLGVLAGKADAGTVRTDILERMAEEGGLDLSALKILNTRQEAQFSARHSTRLYPEWPFARLRHTEQRLSEEVAVALLRMPANSEACRAAQIGGWTVPLNYQQVHELFQELKLPPYANQHGRIGLADLLEHHRAGLFLTLFLSCAILLSLLAILRINGKLRAAQAELAERLREVQTSQEAVRESERNYREIFHSANDAFLIHDLASAEILDVNTAMCELYGYSREEALRLTVGDLLGPDDPLQAELATDRLIARVMAYGPQRFEARARRKDGELFWGEVHLKLAKIGGQERLLAVVHNIEARKRAEEELQRYSQHLEQFVEERTAELRRSESSLAEAQRIAHLGNWVWQIPENQVWWSAEAQRIYGFDAAGGPPSYEAFLAVVHPEDRDLVVRAIDAALKGRQPYRLGHRLLLPDDGERHVHAQGEVSFSADGRPVRMVGIVQDITERVALEKQLRHAEKLKAIGTLAGGVAHDFNNILTAILGYGEMVMAELPQGSQLREDQQQVLAAGQRAAELVKQILTFSRRGEQELRPLRVQVLVKEAVKLLRASIPSTVEFRFNIDDRCGAILGDPTQIHQVLMNLCTNAYHAMRGQGKGLLTLSLAEVELGPDSLAEKDELLPGSYVRLEVSDTGQGMDRAVLERIFEPYFTTKAQGEGTGLGLSLIHGIVKGMGGGISVRSEVGAGTAFQVYFPRIESPAGQAELAPETVRGGNERLLVVDDEASVVNLEQQFLKGLGYRVTATTESSEAWQLYQDNPAAFDLVVTDMTMPRMSGAELARKMLLLRVDLPIILCTGHSEAIDQEKARQLGVRAYLTKPLTKNILAAAIRRTLDRQASH